MSTMVERVARAIEPEVQMLVYEMKYVTIADLVTIACTAIEAMRSPTFDPESVSYHDGMTRTDWWGAMIQAALKEKA